MVNYFDYEEGKTRTDHLKIENEIWKPVHQARVDAGELAGWGIGVRVLPIGSAMPYHDITVDFYDNMLQMMTPNYEKHFSAVHPTKKVADLMEETGATVSRIKADVRVLLDSAQ